MAHNFRRSQTNKQTNFLGGVHITVQGTGRGRIITTGHRGAAEWHIYNSGASGLTQGPPVVIRGKGPAGATLVFHEGPIPNADAAASKIGTGSSQATTGTHAHAQGSAGDPANVDSGDPSGHEDEGSAASEDPMNILDDPFLRAAYNAFISGDYKRKDPLSLASMLFAAAGPQSSMNGVQAGSFASSSSDTMTAREEEKMREFYAYLASPANRDAIREATGGQFLATATMRGDEDVIINTPSYGPRGKKVIIDLNSGAARC